MVEFVADDDAIVEDISEGEEKDDDDGVDVCAVEDLRGLIILAHDSNSLTDWSIVPEVKLPIGIKSKSSSFSVWDTSSSCDGIMEMGIFVMILAGFSSGVVENGIFANGNKRCFP